MTYATVRISADEVSEEIEQDTFPTYELERVSVSFPAEDSAGDFCRHCGEMIEEEDGVWTHVDTVATWCDGQRGEVSKIYAEPDRSPGMWCNSAAITVDEEENSVTVSISLGDPRGAFTMTARRLEDGTLVLYVPSTSDAMSHMPLIPIREGAFEVGA